MADDDSLTMFVIYSRPSELPFPFVVREWRVTKKGPEPTNRAKAAESLEEARQLVPEGMVRVERDPTDDEVIVESWV